MRDEMDKIMDQMAKVQDEIDAANAWDLDRQLEIAMDAMRLPPARCNADDAVRRRTPPRRAVQDAAAEARPVAARRADQPSRRRVGQPGSNDTCRSTPAPSWPSRTIATSSTTSPSGSWNWIAASAIR